MVVVRGTMGLTAATTPQALEADSEGACTQRIALIAQ